TDGINWTGHWPGREIGLFNIAYGDGRFVTVGYGGAILESGPMITLSLAPSHVTGMPSLSVDGPSGLDYTIQISNDLTSWRNVTNITSDQTGHATLDVAPPSYAPSSFYRAQVR